MFKEELLELLGINTERVAEAVITIKSGDEPIMAKVTYFVKEFGDETLTHKYFITTTEVDDNGC